MDETASPSLPVVWADVNEKNVSQLEVLNTTIFPVKYDHVFYRDVLKAPEGFVKLAYFNELLVGGVCCRKEPYVESHVAPEKQLLVESKTAPPSPPKKQASLYIMTLGVLAPYRERGIGHRLITHVLDVAESSPVCEDIVDVYLHLQDGNEDALRFYTRYGFEITEYIQGYYRRLDPPNCFVVRKKVIR
ncbi:unnamed protein product [Agarophyton chilense]